MVEIDANWVNQSRFCFEEPKKETPAPAKVILLVDPKT